MSFTFVRVGFEIARTVCFLRNTALASTVLLAVNFFDAVVSRQCHSTAVAWGYIDGLYFSIKAIASSTASEYLATPTPLIV